MTFLIFIFWGVYTGLVPYWFISLGVIEALLIFIHRILKED